MPSKQKKGHKNVDMPSKERAPLQPNTDVEEPNDLDEDLSINSAPIAIAPEWDTGYHDPNDKSYSESLFFDTTNDEWCTSLFDGYTWCGISDQQTTNVASQLTVENAKDTGIVGFVCYDKISLSTELAFIYQFIIQFLQSIDNSDTADVIYPWNLIYPQSKETGLPILSDNGLYFIKLFFCGQWRAILIDDKVPIFDGKLLFPTVADTNEWWPQLLTKAILKFLILSHRFHGELCVALIVQLLTSHKVTTEVSQNHSSIPYKYITQSAENEDEKSEVVWPMNLLNIEDWSATQTQNACNALMMSEDIDHGSQTCCAIMHCPLHDATQTVNDLCNDGKAFSNDMTVMIATANDATQANDTFDVILQIDSLDANASGKVRIFIYDQANNIKKAIQIMHMTHGFASCVVCAVPKQIYLIEVDGNISYSVSAHWNSRRSNVYIAPRFGDETIWNMMEYKMVQIASESKHHPISQTFVLFNIHVVVLSQQCHILFHCVFDDDDKSLSNSLIFYCVNLDNHSFKFIPNLNVSTLNLAPNQNGYSLIAFARPTQVIKKSKYEIKLLYQGDIEQNIIDMQSSLDFQIDYRHNYDVTVMKDEIICDNTSNAEYIFMFCEVYFRTKADDYGAFGKVIEFINKDTCDIVAKYESTQSILYVPQIMMTDPQSKLWFVIKLDRKNAGSNPKQLFHDNSIQCMVRIISNAPVRLFPDNSQQIKFDKIKQSWQVAKGRAEDACQTRQKYLQKHPDNAAVPIKQTPNKDAVVVNEVFWTKDGEIKDTLLQESSRSIQNEQQFRANQNIEINDHNAYIENIQKESFQNMQTFTNSDLKERGELRSERLEWNQILSEMNALNSEMKENFNNFRQMLTKFHDEVNTMVQENAAAEPPKKGKTKSKAKATKPNTNHLTFPTDVSKLIELCKKVEQNVPRWVYGDTISECNVEIHSILYHVYRQINTQFAELVDHIKATLQDTENDAFDECSEKYIDLCLAIFEQVRAVAEWKASTNWDAKLQDIQNGCDDTMIDSVFAKLQSMISMDSANNNNDAEDDRTDAIDENEATPINVEMVKEHLNSIQFVSESKRNVVIKQRTMELNERYMRYIQNIEQWIQQQQE